MRLNEFMMSFIDFIGFLVFHQIMEGSRKLDKRTNNGKIRLFFLSSVAKCDGPTPFRGWQHDRKKVKLSSLKWWRSNVGLNRGKCKFKLNEFCDLRIDFRSAIVGGERLSFLFIFFYGPPRGWLPRRR